MSEHTESLDKGYNEIPYPTEYLKKRYMLFTQKNIEEIARANMPQQCTLTVEQVQTYLQELRSNGVET